MSVSTTNNNTIDKVVFNGPADFEAWSTAYGNKAKRHNLLSFIGRDASGNEVPVTPWPIEPVMPEFSDFPTRRNNRITTGNATMEGAMSGLTNTNSHDDDITGEVDYLDLMIAGKENYAAAEKRYNINLRWYE
ncbi:hypothetical protein B0T25DRAFT_537053 [Lasiosphaeria hispida]|uniref:Uncharacterized protein n=1 Tax=Lasiosphaeria hispida TaxID=260671 RepID=A0AAJ0MFD7_9PEZI|nr:hypothetical protein B0T25DRAFT_537053 [Lasiosphaeria hispida]